MLSRVKTCSQAKDGIPQQPDSSDMPRHRLDCIRSSGAGEGQTIPADNCSGGRQWLKVMHHNAPVSSTLFHFSHQKLSTFCSVMYQNFDKKREISENMTADVEMKWLLTLATSALTSSMS